MFKWLKWKLTRYITRVELRDIIWFDCDSSEIEIVESETKPNRKYIGFHDGLRIIVENGEYKGFYTQNPCDR